MSDNISIADKVYLICVNDRRTQLFENMWSLPQGVTYNSYLIADEKNALMDTVQYGSESVYVERLESMLEGRQLDYLVIHHMEPDHSGEIEAVINRWPDIKLVGNAQTRKILANYYPAAVQNFMEVADGDTLSLGSRTLKFYMTPWIHWPETMMTYETTGRMLFTGDGFGAFGAVDGDPVGDVETLRSYESEMRRYYVNIVGKYCGMVQKALKKLAELDVDTICPLHGPVWRGDSVKAAFGLYDDWSLQKGGDSVTVIYGSMYGNTARMANHIASQLGALGVDDVTVMDISKQNLSYATSEIWRSRYVVLGSCSYNAGMFPLMDNLCTALLNVGLKERRLALFGSGSWNGGGVRMLKEFAEKSGWPQVCEPVEAFGLATPDKLAALNPIAEAIAKDLKGDGNA